MVSSSRPAVACILLIAGAAFYSQAQTNPVKTPSASISGHVTVKGKSVPGITVIAMTVNNRGPAGARHYGTTDSSGKYRISNVAEGSYQIFPYALALAYENERATLMVGDGETVEDINFALVPGGVITGKITDSEGQPLIEEPVHVTRINGATDIRIYRSWIHTDDRGVYRAFGLRPGQYKVSAGQSEYRMHGNSRHAYRQTFHPSTTNETKATVIEVSEGSETKNVDIVMLGRAAGFKVAGRIIDGETKKPLSNMVYGLTYIHEGGTSSSSGPRSNADGEFKFENIAPGKYSVYIQPPPDSGTRATPVSFEVTDRDVTELTITTSKATTLSGIVVLEGTDEKPFITKPGEFYIQAYVQSNDPSEHHNTHAPMIQPDGTFKITGLRGGTAHISVGSSSSSHSELAIVRIERDGIAQPNNTIKLKDGEQAEGVRVVVTRFTGVIRGEVKIEDGQLPAGASMSAGAVLLDEDPNTRSHRSEQVDARGRFSLDALKAGRYEVTAWVYIPGPQPKHFQTKKEVTVSENTVTEVVLTLKLNPQ